MSRKFLPNEPVPPYRVGVFVSSSDPRKHVVMVAVGEDQIAEYGEHRDFVRWLTPLAAIHAIAAPPTQAVQPTPDAQTQCDCDKHPSGSYCDNACAPPAPAPVQAAPTEAERDAAKGYRLLKLLTFPFNPALGDEIQLESPSAKTREAVHWLKENGYIVGVPDPVAGFFRIVRMPDRAAMQAAQGLETKP